MAKINLVPTRVSPESTSTKIANSLTRINIWGFLFLVIVASILLIYFLFISLSLSQSKSHQQTLIASIKSQEDSETKLTLLKDRGEKLKIVYEQDTALSQIDKYEGTSSDFSSEISIKSATLAKGRSDLDLNSTSPFGFRQIIQNFSLRNLYNKVVLNTLNFSPNSGYSIGISTSDK